MKIVAIGGGKIRNWNFERWNTSQKKYETEKIDKEIVKLAEKENPNMLFIGTAKADNLIYFQAMKDIYTNLGCNVTMLETYEYEKMRETILKADIIYIGGGSTRILMAQWKKYNVYDVIAEAARKNIVIAGYSAGAYVLFLYNYLWQDGIGLLPYIGCVHYDKKIQEKKDKFYGIMKFKQIPGIALENRTALLVTDERFELVRETEEKGYYIEYIGDEYIVKEIK